MMSRELFIVSILLMTQAFSGASGGQEGQIVAPAAVEQAADPVPDSEGAGDVYLDDSFEGADALSKAQTLATEKRWSRAAALLQQTVDQYGRKITQTEPGLYVGIAQRVAELIASWPRDGLEAYRSLAEPQLESELQQIDSTREVYDLVPLFDRYFCTAGAGRLADHIAQLAIESGEFSLAERVLRRVVAHHPDSQEYAPRYLALLTIVGELTSRVPQEADVGQGSVNLRWKGRDRSLMEILNDCRASFSGVFQPADPNTWPMLGGNAERNRAATFNVSEPGLLWRFDLESPEKDDAEPDLADALSDSDRRSNNRASMQPVVSGEYIYLQRHREVMVLHRHSGTLAWVYRPDSHPAESNRAWVDHPATMDCVTLHERRLYVSLPPDSSSYYSVDADRRVAEIVCLQADSGRVIWRTEPKALDARAWEMRFDSPPILRNDRLFVVGRRRRSFDFEDCYLYRLHAGSGASEFRVHLGSSSTGPVGTRQSGGTVAAMHGDTVYVCTGLGTVAAVSAYSGAVQWLRSYPRSREDGFREAGRSVHESSPWRLNTVVWANGRVLAFPTDADNLLVLDDKTGAYMQSIPARRLGDMETLIGVRGETMCGAGGEVGCFDTSSGAPLWTAPLPPDTRLAGRGVWTDRELIIPTVETGLIRFDADTGTRLEPDWDFVREGGNLLALPDVLLVAGPGHVAALVSKAEIWQTLRGRMSAAPDDPLPALELAEVALGAREREQALATLDEAVRRADRASARLDPLVRARLLDALRRCAGSAVQQGDAPESVLQNLHDHAARFADDAASNIAYRLEFAVFFEQAKRPDRALRLYHQILRDRTLRDTPWPSVDCSATTAGGLARTRISALLDKYGRALYDDFEAEARNWLEAAKAIGDESVFIRLFETFPDSQAAAQGRVDYGDWLDSQKRFREAAAAYIRVFDRFKHRPEAPRIIGKIVEALVRAQTPKIAYAWLSWGAAEFPSISVELEHRPTTFQQYREHLAATHSGIEPSPPNISLPLDLHYELQLDEGGRLLVPRFGADTGQRWSRFFIYEPATGIQCYQPKSGKKAWPYPVPVPMEPELLLSTTKVVAFATPYELFGLEAETGQRRWSHGRYPAHVPDPLGDWEAGGAIRALAMGGRHIVVVFDTGEMTCLDIDTGRKLWSHSGRPAPFGPMRFVYPNIVYHIVQDGRPRLCVVDAVDGNWLGAINLGETRPIEDLFLTLDGHALAMTSMSILFLDLDSFQCRWKVQVPGHIRSGSALLEPDGFYFSDSGVEVKRVDLDDGRLVWVSKRLGPRGAEDLSLYAPSAAGDRQALSLLATTSESVLAIDKETGTVLWRGTLPERPRLVARIPTRGYMAVVNGERVDGVETGTAYFYDLENASGLIPRDGGGLLVGPLENLRSVMAVDDGLVAQVGSALRIFVHQAP